MTVMELCHAGSHNKYEYFEVRVWCEADGPELIGLDEFLDNFS
jgi:hypothetical protein